MRQPLSSREVVFIGVLALTAIVWILRGIGLLTFLPGFVLGLLVSLSIALLVINGLIETR
ncbi:hypothetical protein [Myxacorys almedinensis]|uniref:Uncharacterized protein n=1 Tax=Myxacorys almedinensis A TaxID=2690445 RepID=A0A8J8CMP6_9CYAN|nr:hypothetical protein [Myxacorys almedinensis A]